MCHHINTKISYSANTLNSVRQVSCVRLSHGYFCRFILELFYKLNRLRLFSILPIPSIVYSLISVILPIRTHSYTLPHTSEPISSDTSVVHSFGASQRIHHLHWFCYSIIPRIGFSYSSPLVFPSVVSSFDTSHTSLAKSTIHILNMFFYLLRPLYHLPDSDDYICPIIHGHLSHVMISWIPTVSLQLWYIW